MESTNAGTNSSATKDVASREQELRMENLAKFKSIKNMNDRFKNFVTKFQENERLLSTKFKHAKILYDDGLLDKDLDLEKKFSLDEPASEIPRRPSRRSLIDDQNLSGSKSARNPFDEEQEIFTLDTSPKLKRQKALSGDLNNESFSNFSEEEVEPPTQMTLMEKFINEIGYKH